MLEKIVDKETITTLKVYISEINELLEEQFSQGFSISSLDSRIVSELLLPLQKGVEVALVGLIKNSDGALGCGLSHINLGTKIEEKLLVMSTGGKKLRPTLYLLSEIIISQSKLSEIHLILAGLVELTHLLSLIVDDLVDREKRRRKQTTLHISIEECLHEKGIKEVLATSITGLILGTFNPGVNFVMRKSLELGQDLGLGNLLYYLTYEAQNKLWLGFKNEILMNEFLKEHYISGTLAEYLKMIDGKTATLFVYSVALALVNNGISRQAKDSIILEDLVRRIGIAFQIADDTRDLWDAHYKERGVGGDIIEEKPSVLTMLASIYLPEEANRKFFSLLGPQTNIEEVQTLFEEPLINVDTIDESFYQNYGLRISKSKVSILELATAMYYFNIQRARKIIASKEIEDKTIHSCALLIFNYFSKDLEKFKTFVQDYNVSLDYFISDS
ncbi:MAG: polyprenyl synthetase family protein [Promethearchaeota archaeon]